MCYLQIAWPICPPSQIRVPPALSQGVVPYRAITLRWYVVPLGCWKLMLGWLFRVAWASGLLARRR